MTGTIFFFTKHILFFFLKLYMAVSLPHFFTSIVFAKMLKYTYVQNIYKYDYITESWTILNLKTNS